ncbi:MAG: MATE family efflux transporter [Muribaculaceae bacterium]|nr:MATE family efflux transporter [Muribaculaceae bacterium]
MKHLWSKYNANYKSIIKLGIPILIGQLGMIVVGFADNIMVGKYSTEALASASFVNNLFNVAIFACLGFSYGLTPLIGALYSQKRDDAIGDLLKNGLLLNMLFALVVTGIMTVFYFNLENMGQPEELLPLIRPYFLIYLAGMLTTSLFNVFAQWAYAINRSKMPMWIILISNVINVVGNWLLIYGNCGFPEMGLIGAGLSTLLARVFCPVAIIIVFFSFRCYKSYSKGFRESKITINRLCQVNRTSWPVALQMSLESGSFTIAAVMAGWLGAISLAAYQIIVITGTLGFCIYYSIAASVSVLVSNAAGLCDNKAMRQVAFAGYHLLLTLAAISSTIFVIFGENIIEFFTNDVAVITTTVTLIFPLVLYQLSDATQINFANALRGTSNVMPMLWIAFVSYVVIGIPATYLLGFTAGMGIYGIILSFSASLFMAAALFLFYFLKTTRKYKC